MNTLAAIIASAATVALAAIHHPAAFATLALAVVCINAAWRKTK